MNTKSSLQSKGKEITMFDKKKENTMISKIERKRIIIFVAIAYAISISLALAVYLGGGIFDSFPFGMKLHAFILMAGLMFAPTVANIATRLITREGWSNTLLRPRIRRGWRFYLAAWVLPVLATVAGGLIYYMLFPGRFDASMTFARDTWGLVPVVESASPWAVIITQAAFTILITPIYILLGFGEEFGWRAYLLQKLMPLGARKAVLLLGVIWAVWHWPFFLMGYNYGFNYWGAPVLGALLYLVVVFFFSVFTAWVTLRSGSVWPAALGHMAINNSSSLMLFVIQGDPDYLLGPYPLGIIGSLGYAVLAMLVFFNSRALAPIGSPQPVEEKAIQAAYQSTGVVSDLA